MIIGVLMAIFLVAIVYYVVGIGEAVLYRERMQDASDAAALSASLLHARGMNFIVLINLLMAALVAILLILNVILTLIRVAIIAATLASFVSMGGTATLIVFLGQLHQGVQAVYEWVEPVVMNALTALHQLQDAVRRAVPPVAVLGTMVEVNSHQRGPSKFAFAVPTRLTLPVEPDRYNVLCQKAGTEVARFAVQPLGTSAQEFIGGAVGGIASAASNWLCGDGDVSPPTYQQTEQIVYPSLPGYDACQEDPQLALSDSAQGRRCGELLTQQREGRSDNQGDCPPGADCTLNGPYETLLDLARQQCRPDPRRSRGGYRWQQKTVTATFEWTGEEWREVDRDEAPGRILPLGDRGQGFPPCGNDPRALGEDWNLRVHPADDPHTVLPVCSEDYRSELPPEPGLAVGYHQTVSYEAVTQILSCTESKTFHVPIGGENAHSLGSGGSNRSPHRVESDLALGSEDFQLRALAVGEGLTAAPERVMKMAAHGRCDGGACGGFSQVARDLSHFSVAQAEYYYDHDGSEARSEWMWNMKWRARLVRVLPFESEDSAPASEARPSPTDLCSAVPGSGGCPEAVSSLDALAEGSLH